MLRLLSVELFRERDACFFVFLVTFAGLVRTKDGDIETRLGLVCGAKYVTGVAVQKCASGEWSSSEETVSE